MALEPWTIVQQGSCYSRLLWIRRRRWIKLHRHLSVWESSERQTETSHQMLSPLSLADAIFPCLLANRESRYNTENQHVCAHERTDKNISQSFRESVEFIFCSIQDIIYTLKVNTCERLKFWSVMKSLGFPLPISLHHYTAQYCSSSE